MLGIHGLLRGHVVHGAHHLARAGQLILLAAGRLQSRQAHVQDLDRALLIQQQVRGLDVPVDDALLVCVLPARGPLAGCSPAPAPPAMAVFLDERRQVLPSTYSITRKCVPPASSASWAMTMLGCVSLAAALTSR